MNGKQINRRTRWIVVQPTSRIKMIPVYRIPERTDGKPSINTPEGWERYRVKCLIQMRLLEMMEKQENSTKKDVSPNCTRSD